MRPEQRRVRQDDAPLRHALRQPGDQHQGQRQVGPIQRQAAQWQWPQSRKGSHHGQQRQPQPGPDQYGQRQTERSQQRSR